MKPKLNNQYFILRHGQTSQQVKRKKFIYNWPDIPPAKLTKKGIGQIEKSAKKLTSQKIDLIYSSDIYRTRQTAGIVAKRLKVRVNFDKRLRDINLGVYHGRLKKDFYQDFILSAKRFSQRPKGGESWSDLEKRLLNILKEIEKKNQQKIILIVSHGDPLWLFQGIVRGWSKERLIKEVSTKSYIKTGELRRI